MCMEVRARLPSNMNSEDSTHAIRFTAPSAAEPVHTPNPPATDSSHSTNQRSFLYKSHSRLTDVAGHTY